MALVPPADQPDPRWHVSAAVDLAAYAWSWLPPLLLLLAFGDEHPKDYLVPFAVLVGFSTMHRHATIPYVAFDRDVFGSAPYAFTVFPAALLAGFVISGVGFGHVITAGSLGAAEAVAAASAPIVALQLWGGLADGHRFRAGPLLLAAAGVLLALAGPVGGAGALAGALAGVFAAAVLAADQRALASWLAPAALLGIGALAAGAGLRWPATDLPVNALIDAVALFAGAWNIWHVLQQKYGILRLYAAKGRIAAPPWVDRLLLYGTLPLAVLGVAEQIRPFLVRSANELTHLLPVVDALTGSPAPRLGAAAIAALSVGTFVVHATRHPSAPRLHLAAGIVALHSAFLFVPPLKAYIAYATSHALEYYVFLWAFQRRRYQHPLAHQPLMGRIVAHFHGMYWLMLIGGGTVAYVAAYHDELWLDRAPVVFGLELWRWVFLWGIWQSMSHFYWDSFLWKMRAPATRGAL